MPYALLLPTDGNLTLFIEESAAGTPDFELFRRSTAEAHLIRLLFLFDSGFVQYHPRVLAWERDLWKSEGIQNQIRTVREFELLPDNRIKGDIGSKIEDRHVLHEPSLGELNGSAFPFILREAQQLDSSVRFCFVVRDRLEVFLFDESHNRVRVLGRIERCTGGRRLSSRHRREQESEKKQHNWKHRHHYNRGLSNCRTGLRRLHGTVSSIRYYPQRDLEHERYSS